MTFTLRFTLYDASGKVQPARHRALVIAAP
jgi:hypothetical protein